MSGSGPKAVSDLPSITPKALAFAFSKFQFKFGAAAVLLAIFLFVASEFLPLVKYFSPAFPGRAWIFAICLFAFGVALCGKEVAQTFISVVRAIAKEFRPGAST